jgi:anthranilate synthase/aminodeoxychorismate synthase-like glutamine amidotransferase
MILLIDNYDSFVYNLARYVGQIGYERKVVRNNKITIQEIDALKPSHIILSPGPCAPNEAGICLDVITAFYSKIPILGICLGHQAIGQAFGGKIIRAKEPKHGKEATISHDGCGIFAKIDSPLKVGLYHSLAVSDDDFPQSLKVTARSENAEIMAITHRQHPVVGVQFHPESVLTSQGYQLLCNFLMPNSQSVNKNGRKLSELCV